MALADLRPGDRVRILGDWPPIRFSSRLGTVKGKDEYADYWLIILDEPALYRDVQGNYSEKVPVLRWDEDDLLKVTDGRE